MNDVTLSRDGLPAPAPRSQTDAGVFTPVGADDGSLLRYYLMVLRRRKWLILGAVVIAMLIGLALTLMMTPKYTATTTIEIQRDSYRITGVQSVEPETTPSDMEFYQTQYGLLRAESLAKRVAADLRLADEPSFFQMFGAGEADLWFDNGRVRPTAPSRDLRLQKAAEILVDHLGVSPVRLSRLVNITFTSPNPDFSARVANKWAQLFIQTTLDRRLEATSYGRHFLEQRLAQLRTRLEESERLLVGYAAREGIVNLPSAAPRTANGGGAETAERSIVADNLEAMNRELAQATAERVTAQARVQSGGRVAQEMLTNEAISGLRQRRAELTAEYSSLMTRFEPAYPSAVAMRMQIQQLDQAISREEARVRTALQGAYGASSAREADLSRRVADLRGQMLDLRRRSIQYNIYQREVDTNRQLYDALLQRYHEIGVAGGVGVNNISVVDEAQPPERPSSPRLVLNLLMSVLAGAFLGLVLAFLREQIDDAVADPSQIESAFGIPVLGSVPKSAEADLMLALSDRKSDVSEAYLAVQTSLSFATPHGTPKTLTVTSTRPGEGKSTTAFALASSLARGGAKVVLVDGDMRSPSVHHQLMLSNERGLSNFLAGEDDLPSLIHPAGPENLYVMPAGPPPPSAAELLSGDRLSKLMRELSARFDHVLVDAPPVMGLADAPLLAANVEGVVFVLESHSTKIAPARLAVGRLRAAHANLLGAVLTKFETKRATYGYGYGYGHGYGYGDKGDTAKA